MKRYIRKYFPGLFPIEKYTTDYNYLEVNKRYGRLVLDSKNVNYSFGALHHVFQKAFSLTKFDVSSFQRALILGFGGGSVAFILQKELGFQGTITGVEIDEKVMVLSRKYLGLENLSNLKVEITDAYDFVFHQQHNYDLIVVDLFTDHIIPEKFDKKDFLYQLNLLLEKGGMLLYNRMNQSYKDKNRIQVFRKAFGDVFKEAEISEEFKIDSKNIIFYVKK
ncbi:MAG: methyltransferase domain-containing protein [Bacteroidales bacterium]|nr:methyltransferase domain-containing protein [Bacteroidales bacterium]